jgi:hypothetical protein
MKTVLLAILSLCPVFAFGQAASVEQTGKSPVELKFDSGGQLHMDLCSSGIELRGVDENVVRVSYWPQTERSDEVKVRLRSEGNRGQLRITGCPHNNFQIKIEVPKASDLYIRMFAGELVVKDVTGNKDIGLSAGQLTMDIGEVADYSHVYASVSTGELDARPFDVEKGGLFRSFERSGSGKYRLHAHVGAGELDLR